MADWRIADLRKAASACLPVREVLISAITFAAKAARSDHEGSGQYPRAELTGCPSVDGLYHPPFGSPPPPSPFPSSRCHYHSPCLSTTHVRLRHVLLLLRLCCPCMYVCMHTYVRTDVRMYMCMRVYHQLLTYNKETGAYTVPIYGNLIEVCDFLYSYQELYVRVQSKKKKPTKRLKSKRGEAQVDDDDDAGGGGGEDEEEEADAQFLIFRYSLSPARPL
eukprot:GHVU01049355.1.p1 GENE.GHVU01049355.1~~GHVU01049355.1.p1  ORF type:complete len:220 (-),score=23.78 GHVU01049355.1:521-1180(-)